MTLRGILTGHVAAAGAISRGLRTASSSRGTASLSDRGATGSNWVNITVTGGTTTVAAPSALTASVSGKVVTLRWTDNASNEQGFYVERGVKPKKGNPTFSRVGQVGANVTTFSQSPGRGTYLYRVQAFNRTTGRTSAYSNQVQARVR